MVQLVPTAGEQIVVCQCHRSCGYVEMSGLLPLVQLLAKVADVPVASLTGAWGRQCRKLRSCSCCAHAEFDDPVVLVVVRVLPGLL